MQDYIRLGTASANEMRFGVKPTTRCRLIRSMICSPVHASTVLRLRLPVKNNGEGQGDNEHNTHADLNFTSFGLEMIML